MGAIDKIYRCDKSFILKFEGHGCLSKKCEANFNYMTVFALGRSVLLMCMWT